MKLNPKYAYLFVSFNLIDSDPMIAELCDNALRKGATPTYDGETAIYPIESQYLMPDHANYVVSVGGRIEQYSIKRFLAVADLASELPVELPESSVTDEDGNTRQLTHQEVQDRPTVDVPVRVDGNYYFDCTAHLSFRGLTLDEYNVAASTLSLVMQSDLPDITTEE